MKNKLLLFLLCLPFFLFAQADETTGYQKQKWFLDADVGAFLQPSDGGDISVQLSLNSGYSLNNHVGIGLEAKYFAKSGDYTSNSALGLGGFFRYEYKGFYFKPSFGKILYGQYSTEYAENEKADFHSASYYIAGTAGYRLKNGLLLGINIGHANRVSFDYYTTDDVFTSTNDPLLYRGIYDEKFATFCLVVGYTWPRKQQ